MGERLDRTQEVAGSSPASSIKKPPGHRGFLFTGLETPSGAVGLLRKPVEMNHLLSTVARYCPRP